jgi:hypothetical protein
MIKTGECALCTTKFRQNGSDKFEDAIETHLINEHPEHVEAIKAERRDVKPKIDAIRQSLQYHYLSTGGFLSLNHRKFLKGENENTTIDSLEEK